MTSNDTAKLAKAISAALLLAFTPGLASARSSTDVVSSMDKLATAAAPSSSNKSVFSHYTESGSLRLGASMGPDFFSSTTGFRLQGDLQYTLFEVSPQLEMDLAGQLAGVFASGVTVLEAVPKLRLRLTAFEPLSLYADAGLGLAYSSLGGPAGTSYTQLWGSFRIAGGVQYKFTPEWSMVMEPVGLNTYFGSNSSFHYSILAGFLYRMM